MMYTSLLRIGVLLLTLAYGFSCEAGPKHLSVTDLAETFKSGMGTPKEPFTFKRGDYELTFGGNLKIENFIDNNMYTLNKNAHDQDVYFREILNLNVDVAYGKEKFGYKAVEMYANLLQKGVWARATKYADRESSPNAPSLVKLSQSYIGSHSHVSGKSMPWFNEMWLQFSPNAAITNTDVCLHQLKLGWFPFVFGRGIALGTYYSTNKAFLGISTYAEDKARPGIDLHGVLVKGRLEYDVYYSKIEERGSYWTDNITFDRLQIIGRYGTPWRGVGKDNDLFGARLQWKALKDSKVGTLDVEPYVFYNAASDQQVEIPVDSKVKWGAYGVSLEHTHGDFECGGEVAFNYGKQYVFAIDRDVTQIANVNGQIVEQYSQIYTAPPFLNGQKNPAAKNALVTPTSTAALKLESFNVPDITALNSTLTNGVEINSSGLWNSTRRFRPAFNNKYDGWMAVVDGAYNFKAWDLKIAAAFGYASGDYDPNDESRQYNKNYHGFIGLHEGYAGKRVPSVALLDQRFLKRPLPLTSSDIDDLVTDISFTNIEYAGLGVNWTPKCCIKKLTINPNILGFWSAKDSYKFNFSTDKISPIDKARNFLGTEFNIVSSCLVLQDLKMFANIAFFFPGGYFTDMKGLTINDAYYKLLGAQGSDVDDEYDEELDFSLGDNTAYFVNIGFDYKF